MSVYGVIDVIGTSSESWEDAAAQAIKTAGQSVRDLRVGEVVEQDIHVTDDSALVYRTKLRLSFRYETQQSVPAAPLGRRVADALEALIEGRGEAAPGPASEHVAAAAQWPDHPKGDCHGCRSRPHR